MIRLSIRLLTALSLGASALTVAGPALTTLKAADAGMSVVSGKSAIARRLQLGVGKSVIIDLPEDASEIFVGEPKIANAIVRSPRRLYVDAIANGETTIFAMDGKGRQIAVLEISVGRDVGELQELLRAAIPGNDITVKTVADSVILMGSVASAGEAQKAIDIATSFTGVSVIGGAASAAAPAASPGGGSSVNIAAGNTPVVSGKVINVTNRAAWAGPRCRTSFKR